MKKIFFLFAIFLSGCSNSLKVGDCIKENEIWKIINIGKYSVEATDWRGDTTIIINKNWERVDCFDWFDNKGENK